MARKPLKNKSNSEQEALKSEISARLNSLAEGRTIRETAELWNVSTATVDLYLRKGGMPSIDKAAFIAKQEDVSLEWLILGKKKVKRKVHVIRENHISFHLDLEDMPSTPEEWFGYQNKIIEVDISDVQPSDLIFDECFFHTEIENSNQVKDYYFSVINSINNSEQNENFILENPDIYHINESVEWNENDYDEDIYLSEYDFSHLHLLEISPIDIEKDDFPYAQFRFSEQWLTDQHLNDKVLGIMPVTNDSMEPTLKKNSLIIIEKLSNTDVEDGIYVFKINEKILIKRLQFDYVRNSYQVGSDNPMYKPFFIEDNLKTSFTMIGKVLRVLQSPL